jgi:hypothetical protein
VKKHRVALTHLRAPSLRTHELERYHARGGERMIDEDTG